MRRGIRKYFTPTAAVLRRVGFYGAWLTALLIIQSSLALSPRMAGALPALVSVAVAAIGFFDSEKAGAIAGVAAGWALDAWGGSRVCLMPLMLFAVGFACGYVADRYLPRGIIPFAICLVGVAVLEVPCGAVYAMINYSGLRIGALIVHTLLPIFGRTLLWGIPTALLTRLIARRVRKAEKDRSVTDEQ